jgi:hypothetical protein
MRSPLPKLSLAAGFLAAALSSAAPAQTPPDLRQVLERLDRLEAQNQALMTEIRALREQLRAAAEPGAVPSAAAQVPELESPVSTPPVEERVEVQERRLAELDQAKIGADHRLPVQLTGMALFNAFLNGKGAGGAQYPTTASNTRQASAGGSFRQTVLGLKYDGPSIAGGGKIGGSLYMDFFSGNTGLGQTLRLRVASLDVAWKTTTVSLAFDKPLIAPRDPDSLAQVGLSPLTAAGNLWLWQPQVRLEQRFALGTQAGVRAQLGMYQTSEGGTGLLTGEYADSLAPARPGYEGRFEFWRALGETRRIEIAPGFHLSHTRVAGQSVPSRIFSMDWLIRPVSRVDITGAFFNGENVGVIGGLRQGVVILNDRSAEGVRALGGWAQVKLRLTSRLSLNSFGGQEDDSNSHLSRGAIGKNQTYGANLIYRLSTNVLTGFEASQVRTTYIGSATRINQHYDLAIGYLF